MKKFRKYMDSLSLSPSEYARLLKVSPSCIRWWYTGKFSPSPRNAAKIVKFSNGQLELEDLGYTLKNGRVRVLKKEK